MARRSYPPYYAESPFEIYQKILSGHLEFARHFDDNAKELLKRLLTADRLKRIGCLKSGARTAAARHIAWSANIVLGNLHVSVTYM